MTDDLHDLLGKAFADEPPLTIDRAAVLADGKRRLRRRHTLAAGGVALAVAVAVVGTSALAGGAFGLDPPDEIQPAERTAVQLTPTPRSAGPSSTVTQAPVVVTTKTPPTSASVTHRPELPSLAIPHETRARLSDAMQFARIPWPSGVGLRPGFADSANWYEFDGQGALAAELVTTRGSRQLSVQVAATADGPAITQCGNPKTVPDCDYRELPDGTRLEVATVPSNKELAQVLAARPDGTTVLVMEYSGGREDRGSRVLPEDVLVAIATLPGLKR
ncbi:hypothetical protein [Actinokineospora sp. NBRC 105648]|uniref:hypothetical protein n=1 Tax=Actinokineospora sp. NBRC 105648 TaxID=3032206 RepID=UPI0024A1B877|nr:hypothetical protein [Actinokineospora sp. NBRC 105648]GLZ37690.1 hypothetical protein Acsp05_13150 [Actinokineospora sp. NBRC 105648]